MATKNEYNEISKALNKITRSRIDPLSKLVLLVVIGVPILLVVACFALWKLYKVYKAKQDSKPKKLKKLDEKVPPIPPTDTLYYDVKKLVNNKYSLTQYVNFLIIQNNEFVDVTKSMRKYYPELKYYSGKSASMKGTAVLTDYDIVQLYKNLGNINLVQTVGD